MGSRLTQLLSPSRFASLLPVPFLHQGPGWVLPSTRCSHGCWEPIPWDEGRVVQPVWELLGDPATRLECAAAQERFAAPGAMLCC